LISGMVVLFWGGIEGWGTKEEVSRSAGLGCGPELCGPAAGSDLGDARSAGGLEGVEGGVELAGGLVVFEGVADLAAGQACGVGGEGGVDLFGEWLAGRAGQSPGGGPGGIVVERERGVEVRRADVVLAVGEGVEEREADRVRFGAGGDLADDPGVGFGELSVGVMPEPAGAGVEADLARCLGMFEGSWRAGG
jgi:hypothetical protein